MPSNASRHHKNETVLGAAGTLPLVTPAKAGVHRSAVRAGDGWHACKFRAAEQWVPAFAGTTMRGVADFRPDAHFFVRSAAFPEIGEVLGARPPRRIARPFASAAGHVVAVAHAEEKGAPQPVPIFVQLARRVDDKAARRDRDRSLGRRHLAAALEAEIDLGRARMAVIGAGLARLPAGDRDIALPDPAENALDVLLRIEGFFPLEIEDVHFYSYLRARAGGECGIAAEDSQARKFFENTGSINSDH